MLPKTVNGIRFTPASEFDRLVTIMKPGGGQDSEGTPEPLEVFASNVPAKIRATRSSARPDTEQQITQSVAYFDVTIRYLDGIKENMVLVGPAGETWTVTGTNNPGFANVEIVFTVREVNGGQG